MVLEVNILGWFAFSTLQTQPVSQLQLSAASEIGLRLKIERSSDYLVRRDFDTEAVLPGTPFCTLS